MRAASGFEPRTKRLETRALVGSATREASILLLLELLTTVLLDLISIFAESLSMVLRWQSDSQSGLKNPLTVHLMVHFIRPFQATSSSIG